MNNNWITEQNNNCMSDVRNLKSGLKTQLEKTNE